MPEIDWEVFFSDPALRSRLTYFLLSSVKNMDIADELCQQTLAKGWEKKGNLRDPARTEAWLFAIARNVLMDYYRHQGLLFDEEEEQTYTDDAHPSIEQLADLEDALAHLPDIQRKVIELRFYKNCTIQETAKILGRSQQAVKMLQYRALKALRDFLKPSTGEGRHNDDGKY
jgi:RNA polymerase sigma-70 factor (ECF subfamily)